MRWATAAWSRRRTPNWARDIAALRQYGWRTHYISDAVGVNSRLDELQAAILRVKLRHLDTQNARRQAIAAAYDAALHGTALTPPQRRDGVEHVFHLYVLRTPSVLRCRRGCAPQGSAPAFTIRARCICSRRIVDDVALGPSGCRTTEVAAEQVLSLPIYAELTDAQVSQVCEALSREP